MDSDGPLAAIALTASVVLYAFAIVGETSFRSVRREQVQRLVSEGVSGAADLERLHLGPMGPAEALALVKVLALSASVVMASALTFSQSGAHWLVLALAPLGVLLLLSGIYLAASTISPVRRERIALRFARPVKWLAWVLNPVIVGKVKFSNGSHNGTHSDTSTDALPEEEVSDDEPVADPVDEREARMIRGVIRQDKTVAREIMVPRVDIVSVEIGTSIAELAALMVEGGHSRIPVYRGDMDHVAGIAYSRDLLRLLAPQREEPSLSIESVIRPPLFIPESKTLEELLGEFKVRRVHMAIVVDEYGGVSGLVTIEDLLEEIVGEIQDEFDVGESEVQRLSNDEFLMDARVNVDQLTDLFGVLIEGDGFDTLGGFVYQRLGKIPSPGDVVDHDGLRIEVVSTTGRRLKSLRVTRKSGL